MTLAPWVRKEKGAVRTLLLGRLSRRGGRLATLGLAVLVATSFSVVTASASTASLHVRQAAQKNARSPRLSRVSVKQTVRCVSGMGLYRTERACRTRMRLVCHKAPGRTILQKIPKDAYYSGTWNIEFSPHSTPWGPNGPPVNSGRLSIATPRGARREEAIVSRLTGGPPGKQVVISVRCS